MGSISSGGRYDSLASDGRTTYPGVGLSIGVTRLLAPLIGAGRLKPRPGRCRRWCSSRWSRRRPGPRPSRWPSCPPPPGHRLRGGTAADKFGKQIRYADRRGIPFVWFSRPEGGEVKDLRSGDQYAADPQAWHPRRRRTASHRCAGTRDPRSRSRGTAPPDGTQRRWPTAARGGRRAAGRGSVPRAARSLGSLRTFAEPGGSTRASSSAPTSCALPGISPAGGRPGGQHAALGCTTHHVPRCWTPPPGPGGGEGPGGGPHPRRARPAAGSSSLPLATR